MTFAVLRALHAIVGDALDDIQRVYVPQSLDVAHGPPTRDEGLHPPYASPPPSPSTTNDPMRPLDFPSLDAPYDPGDPAEQLTAHPVVVRAINTIVAAAGQMAATVQTPFLSLCDATLAYHIPSCMRLLEASHTVEMLKEAGPDGLHIDDISRQNGVESSKLAHILRLLATHHLLRERAPNVFTINRISSIVDSGKSIEQLRRWEKEGTPEMKYHDTNGIAAFVGLNTDELQKSSNYMTEAYLLSKADPLRTPFEFAFGTDVGYFGWLEGEEAISKAHLSKNSDQDMSVSPSSARKQVRGGIWTDREGIELGPGSVGPVALGISPPPSPSNREGDVGKDNGDRCISPSNRYRLERFGKAMAGTGSWEAPGAVLNGFDWHSLPRGSIIVDVGGGIGSTSMFLANALCRSETSPSPGAWGGSASHTGEYVDSDRGLKFVIQDRPVVVEMGEKAWRAKCPELLDSGTAMFQVHDFFTAQPIKNAAVFFLRVILHDWPDVHARMILLKLREAATADTKLVLADFVLPLACVDDIDGGEGSVLDGVEGAESMLAPAPLLANLGKASANPYWLDMTMHAMFNAQERTLRETVILALSAGWQVIKVTHAVGSLFGHIVAMPVPIPMQRQARAGSGSAFLDVPSVSSSRAATVDNGDRLGKADMDVVERASSRCGTPTFGSRVNLPSFQDALARFGGGIPRPRLSGLIGKTPARQGILKQVMTTPPLKKKKPSPLSFPPPLSYSSSPASHRPNASPRQSQPPTPTTRQMSQAHLHRPKSQQEWSAPPFVVPRQPPPSPMSPRHPHHSILGRRASHAQLSQHATMHSMTSSIPPSPSLPRQFASPSPRPTLSRRSSHAHLNLPPLALGMPPSSIPIRQSQEPLSPLSPTASSPRPPPPPSPATSRHTAIPRRSSYAQLPQTSLRKRSGSIIGPSINGVGIGGGISMASLLNSSGGGGVLNFRDIAERRGESDHEHMSPAGSSGAGGSRSVLAAAARIERGILSVPPSP